jgi:hypothetical protein
MNPRSRLPSRMTDRSVSPFPQTAHGAMCCIHPPERQTL